MFKLHPNDLITVSPSEPVKSIYKSSATSWPIPFPSPIRKAVPATASAGVSIRTCWMSQWFRSLSWWTLQGHCSGHLAAGRYEVWNNWMQEKTLHSSKLLWIGLLYSTNLNIPQKIILTNSAALDAREKCCTSGAPSRKPSAQRQDGGLWSAMISRGRGKIC